MSNSLCELKQENFGCWSNVKVLIFFYILAVISKQLLSFLVLLKMRFYVSYYYVDYFIILCNQRCL